MLLVSFVDNSVVRPLGVAARKLDLATNNLGEAAIAALRRLVLGEVNPFIGCVVRMNSNIHEAALALVQ